MTKYQFTDEQMKDSLYSVIYGVVLDEAGSTDYYDTVNEAAEYADRYGLPVVKITIEPLECLCYSTPEPYCPIHGY